MELTEEHCEILRAVGESPQLAEHFPGGGIPPLHQVTGSTGS